MLSAAETELLREIDRRPGTRVLVSMPKTEAAGLSLVKKCLARIDGAAFLSVQPRKDD